MHKNKTVNELLAKISSPELPSIAPGLERIRGLLEQLGNPHLKIPPVIHVAGTNGKGSVCANLATIYTHAGLKVHRYTSPHLVTFNERIELAGEMISDKMLAECLKEVAAHTDKHPVTFFEATTAAAFLAFSKVKADICILEVGLGGRLDATNVVDTPLLTIITPIGYDHQEYLGHNLEDIAMEKAGILKKGVPCILGEQLPEALRVIKKTANELNVPLYAFGEYWTLNDHTYESAKKLIVFDSNLEGEHQLHNAAIALASVEALNRIKDWDISAKEGSKALGNVKWPGRLQPLELKRTKANVWLDGAHNLMGAIAIASWLQSQSEPRTLVLGMLKNRDIKSFVSLLVPYFDRIIAISGFTEAPSHSTKAIAEVVNELGITCEIVKDLNSLFDKLVDVEGTVLITGSLYLVGAVLAEIE